MRLTNLLLFISTAAAIDIYIHEGNDCKGSYSLCTAVPPDICCGVVSAYGSVAFLGIPTNWHLQLRSYKQYTCNVRHLTVDHLGSTNHCLSQSRATSTGGQYSFVNKKRDGTLEEPQCTVQPADEKCKGRQRPNEVGFADGIRYDLTKLEEAEGDHLMAIVATHGTSAEVPASYGHAKIE